MFSMWEIRALMGSTPTSPLFGMQSKQDTPDAWMHVVETDCKYDKKLRYFIDAIDYHPFYMKSSVNHDFFDAPLWKYTMYYKPCTSWIGHAYAVKINHRAKTISCLGEISWGFRLSYFSLRPNMVHPTPLKLAYWDKDQKIFAGKLDGHTCI